MAMYCVLPRRRYSACILPSAYRKSYQRHCIPPTEIKHDLSVCVLKRPLGTPPVPAALSQPPTDKGTAPA